MRHFASALLLLMFPSVLRAQRLADWRARFIVMAPVTQTTARLDALLSACDQNGAVSSLLAREPTGPTLPVVLHDGAASVVFGGPTSNRSDAPEMQLDLADFDRLPTAAEVHTWPAESSWAATRCEFLIHEVAEGLEYQRRWRAAGLAADDTAQAARRSRVAVRRAAHAFAIEQELGVAFAQATRADSAGTPYMRTGFCIQPEARRLQILLGQHTETLILGRDGRFAIEYHPRENRCALAGLPTSPNVPGSDQ